MELAENRFAHLLQPIRELTKNWDVDVASELADYMEELDEMCISFDGGKTRLNFAEAALLIQGSTCIYSKKVEHLYSLVYQTMDYISDRNKKRDKQTTKGQEGGADESKNRHDMNDASVFDSLDESLKGISHQDSFVNDPTACVEVSPLPPESLIPPEAFEKKKLPLISLKGEVLCSCKDFRMNTFTPDSQGIIRLFLLSTRSNFLRDTLYNSTVTPISLYQEYESGQAAEDVAMAVAGDNEDEGADGVENFPPLEENDVEMEQGPKEHIERHQAAGGGMKLRERLEIQPSEEAQRKQRMAEERALTSNVWKLHDPYAVFGEEKPLKTGKCYRIPSGLDDSGKRKKKRQSVLLDFWSWYTGTYNPSEPKLKNGPSLTDLNYIYLSKMKDKLKTQRRIHRKTGVVVSDEELKRTYLQLEEAEEVEPERLRREQDDNHSDNECEPLTDEIPAEFGGEANILEAVDGISYEDLVKRSVEQFLVNSQGYAQETALSRRVKDWEDMLRPELVLQEERPVMDIHEYGDRIVGALSDVGQRRSFASIVHGLDNFEACKYMLASLQLANDLTVEIDCGAGLESIDTMGLTLMSKHRANERFKNLKGSVPTGDAV